MLGLDLLHHPDNVDHGVVAVVVTVGVLAIILFFAHVVGVGTYDEVEVLHVNVD